MDESEQVINKSCTLYDPNPVTGEGAYGCNTFGFQTYSNRTLRLDILGSFETFGIKHDVTFGSSQLRQLIELPPTFDTYGAAPYTANNLYNPRYYPAVHSDIAPISNKISRNAVVDSRVFSRLHPVRAALGPVDGSQRGQQQGQVERCDRSAGRNARQRPVAEFLPVQCAVSGGVLSRPVGQYWSVKLPSRPSDGERQQHGRRPCF